MTRAIAAALVAFAASWGIGVATGCSFGDDCDCTATPANPEQQAPLTARFASYDDSGNYAPVPIAATNATIELAAGRVVIRYEVDGVPFQVAYQVSPP
jgi:hypothetical protein